MTRPQAAVLPGGRLHLNHGPIDLIIEARGEAGAVSPAYDRASRRFDCLLETLVVELPLLRSPAPVEPKGEVARAMAAAVDPFVPAFITPMAAVAGAVADAVLAALWSGDRGLLTAYVNNGGDIALALAPGQSLTAAIAARAGLPDRVTIRHADPVRGIATSGWRGRSQSRGIADAVTVLATTAAQADAAATMIANAVDLPGHKAVTRLPARQVKADSDLGDRLVTVDVGPLTPDEAAAALARGRGLAEVCLARGLIAGAALFLQGRTEIVGAARPLATPDPTEAEMTLG